MFLHFSKTQKILEQALVAFLVSALMLGLIPYAAFAEETGTTTSETNTETVDPVPDETTEDNSDDVGDAEDTSTSTENENVTEDTVTDDTATSSPETEEEVTGTTTEETTSSNDGSDGDFGFVSDDAPTTTATSTDGTEGDDGSDGSGGGASEGEDSETTATTTSSDPDIEQEPIPIETDGLIGDEGTPEDQDITGGLRQSSQGSVAVRTGIATAQGELYTDANSTNVRSEYDPATIGDLDFYTFNATGTNEANILNEAGAFSLSGENEAYTHTDSRGTVGSGEGIIETGNAMSAFNIANVVNSTIVNSDGYIYLGNQILEEHMSLNLQDFFFPDSDGVLAAANDCSLLSCFAEDIEYNISQTNHAHLTNDAYIEANTGDNILAAGSGGIYTGDAYGAANVMNVVNTNIIDSNYRLLTFNAIGDLDGDLVLPTEELFDAFFGMPNGTNQLEHDDEAHVHVENQNNVDSINNNLDTYAESGLNDVVAPDGDITTGKSEAESNILNKVNQNVFGGDLMYLWIRVHGYWTGDVVGLPDGLTWDWTPDGIIIYNEDAEITPSEFLGYDIDSYTANFENQNDVTIDNNIYIDAITGRNEITNTVHGEVVTGDAYASANVMNIANTNVIGANWTMAIINVMGDFYGNVTFSQTDLKLTGGALGASDPLSPSDELFFTYTIANTSDKVATDVVLSQALVNAHVPGGTSALQEVSIGDLAPGSSVDVDLVAVVDGDLPDGTSTVKAVAVAESGEGDSNSDDNVITETFEALVPTVTDTDTSSTSSDQDTSTTTEDDNTEDDDATGETENDTTTPSVTNNDGGGGGGGGSSNTNSIKRDQKPIDPDTAPVIVVKKTSNVEDGGIVFAGETVEYKITVTNNGGTAYDAVVYDTLRNPIGAVLSEESWELGTILAGEFIELEYETVFNEETPSGHYTNTAHIEAFLEEGGKKNGDDPLKLKDAVHEIEIEGVPLAIANASVLAFYPGANGLVNALLTWETSKPATGQVLYSAESYPSHYSENLLHYGYQNESFKFLTPKTKHYMIIRGLTPGASYEYKVRSTADEYVATRGDQYFTVPGVVSTLTLALPTGYVAGVSTTVGQPTETPSTPSPAIVPTSAYTTPRPAVTVPTPTPTPVPEPEPEQQSSNDSNVSGGGIGGFVNKVFGFFR